MTSPRSLASRLRARLARRPHTPHVVAVLADDLVGPELTTVLAAHPGVPHVIAAEARPVWDLEDSAATFHAASTLDEVNWVLKMIGPVDVLVNLMTKTAAGHEKDWDRLFFNVRKGGDYVIPRDRIQRDDEPGIFRRLVSVMVAESAPKESVSALPPGIRAFTDAVSGVHVDTRKILITKADQHYVKIRDADGSRMLGVRDATHRPGPRDPAGPDVRAPGGRSPPPGRRPRPRPGNDVHSPPAQAAPLHGPDRNGVQRPALRGGGHPSGLLLHHRTPGMVNPR